MIKRINEEIDSMNREPETIEEAPTTREPGLSEFRCPNGHDSSIPPSRPALMFAACRHYTTEATWNEFCVTCGTRHAPFAIYWREYSGGGQYVRLHVKRNYCGYCGVKMVHFAATHSFFNDLP